MRHTDPASVVLCFAIGVVRTGANRVAVADDTPSVVADGTQPQRFTIDIFFALSAATLDKKRCLRWAAG